MDFMSINYEIYYVIMDCILYREYIKLCVNKLFHQFMLLHIFTLTIVVVYFCLHQTDLILLKYCQDSKMKYKKLIN